MCFLLSFFKEGSNFDSLSLSQQYLLLAHGLHHITSTWIISQTKYANDGLKVVKISLEPGTLCGMAQSSLRFECF